MINRVFEESPSLPRRRAIPVQWCGHDLLKRREWRAAERAAKVVLTQDDTHLGALEVLCQVQLQLQQPELALQTIRKMTRLNPQEAAYDALRANAMQALGRYPEALECLYRAQQRTRSEVFRIKLQAEIDLLLDALGLDPSDAGSVATLIKRNSTKRSAQMTIN